MHIIKNGIVYKVLCKENGSKAIYAVIDHNNFASLGKYRFTPSKYQILGRPITLADVLLAIGQSKEYYTGIDATGEFIQAGEFGGMNRTNIMWDLTKSYDDQSQECRDFIGQILGVK